MPQVLESGRRDKAFGVLNRHRAAGKSQAPNALPGIVDGTRNANSLLLFIINKQLILLQELIVFACIIHTLVIIRKTGVRRLE